MKVSRKEINQTYSAMYYFIRVISKLNLLDNKSKEAYNAMNMPWYTSWTAKIKLLK